VLKAKKQGANLSLTAVLDNVFALKGWAILLCIGPTPDDFDFIEHNYGVDSPFT
jgi:hypothetical protein